MNELKHSDNQELTRPKTEGFRNIKPESGMTKEKAKDVLSNNFEKNDNVIPIKCINDELAGKKHPDTGVPFERKIVDTPEGKKEVVVPIFNSEFSAQLPTELYKSSDAAQFKECNSQLKKAVENDKKLEAKFDSVQLEQIKDGETPDGFTWHHDAETGQLKLVDMGIHQKTGHTGGRFIWGGGSDCR